MITISLDEAGVFEENKIGIQDSDTTFIGGLLFDDRNIEGEFEIEEKRVEAYYIAVVNKANDMNPNMNISYPLDLHSSGGKNNEKVKKVKRIVNHTLSEFLRYGTFEKSNLVNKDGDELPERKGQYTVCAIVKSEQGKKSLLSDDNGRFFKDGVASNTYFHMISETVEHLIVHNPLYKTKRFNLDIATRKTSPLSADEAEDYEMLGVSENPNFESLDDKQQFNLMTTDIFRTILTEQMLKERESNVVVERFRVRPIRYYGKTKNHDQVFLYLSDSICSFLSHNASENDLRMVIDKAVILSGKGNILVFSYDTVDVYFQRAWEDMEVKEYYDALKEIYNIFALNTEEAKLYQKYWVKHIEETVKKETYDAVSHGKTPYALIEAVDELRASFLSNTLNPSEAEYIFSVFENATKTIKDTSICPRLIYCINDIGLASSTYRGDFKAAASYFKKCEDYAYTVSIEEYIRTRNRYTNSLLDRFDYEKAIMVTKTSLKLIDGLYNLSKETFGARRRKHFGKNMLAITSSQAGQIAAFMKSGEAEFYFNQALKGFGDDVFNKKITESYRLHYYIEAGNEKAYRIAIAEHTDGFDKPLNQFAIIKKNWESEKVNINYDLYLFLKGLTRFGSDDEISEIWESVKSLESMIEDKSKHSHPWELIYKYMTILAMRMGEEEQAKKYSEKIAGFVGKEPDMLVEFIAISAQAEAMEVMGKNAENKYNELSNLVKNSYPEISKAHEGKKSKEFVKEIFTYMYS